MGIAPKSTNLFELEVDRIIQETRRRDAKRLLIQVPFGLRSHAFSLADRIDKETSAEVVISADPCYGACDLATDEANMIDADLIIHLGHAAPPQAANRNILFVEARATVDIDTLIIISEAVKMLREERRIGLVTTVQHIHKLKQAEELLRSAGKDIVIPARSGNATYDGQILGCNFEGPRAVSDQVDAFLVIGGGNFHGLGVRIATGKRTIVCDPFENQVRDVSELARRLFRKRYAMIDAFRAARKIGVLLVTKSGQLNLNEAHRIRDILSEKGYRCVLLSVSDVRPAVLESFMDIEAFVNTGCPRIALDDQDMFRKPVLTPTEALIAAGAMRWEEYVKEDPAAKGA